MNRQKINYIVCKITLRMLIFDVHLFFIGISCNHDLVKTDPVNPAQHPRVLDCHRITL